MRVAALPLPPAPDEGRHAQARTAHVPEAVAPEVHGEHGENGADPGNGRDPPGLAKIVPPLAEHAPPPGRGRLAADLGQVRPGPARRPPRWPNGRRRMDLTARGDTGIVHGMPLRAPCRYPGRRAAPRR